VTQRGSETYEHEACEQEMKNIDAWWREYWNTHGTIKGVVLSSPDGNKWMQVVDVEYTEEGIVIYVE
jgi:hypothetical protein